MNVNVGDGGGTSGDDRTHPSVRQTIPIGFGLLIAFAFVVYLLVALWPTKGPDVEASVAKPAAVAASASAMNQSPVPLPTPTQVLTSPGLNAGDWNPRARIFGRDILVSADVRFLWIVALSAALGSFVQIATSFSTFLGNQTFQLRWLWWYLLRIPIGAALALLFYFAVRGGFFTNVSGTDVNPYGIAALGGLVGMFSKQAADKLQDVFEELFKSERDQLRNDKLSAGTDTTPATGDGPSTGSG